MDANVKSKWLAKLRSGEYTQGTGYLRNANNEFCCLGVLCELAISEGLEVTLKEPGGMFPESFLYNDFESFPPREVMEWAGLESDNPPIMYGKYDNIAEANDNGMSFEEIAKIIEEQL